MTALYYNRFSFLAKQVAMCINIHTIIHTFQQLEREPEQPPPLIIARAKEERKEESKQRRIERRNITLVFIDT